MRASATIERPAPAVTDREIEFQVDRATAGVIAALESFRTATGLSKAEVARRLELHREEISRLLSEDGSVPSLKSIARLLEGIGLHMDITVRERTPKDKYLFEVRSETAGKILVGGRDF
jgi:DNA-binding phage protein